MKPFYFLLIAITFLTCGQKSNDAIPSSIEKSFQEKLSDAAISIVDPSVKYTPNYVALKYPNGDVPPKTGVCTDVVIRAYRKVGVDLQKEVHEDLKSNFSKYPKFNLFCNFWSNTCKNITE